jgi:tRNA(fMet)-specific endonuclease VapC
VRSLTNSKTNSALQLTCKASFGEKSGLVELDQDAGERSGVIRADLEGRGERIGAYDVLIAGIALARGHILATHNVREFGRVAGLQIEDWAAIP